MKRLLVFALPFLGVSLGVFACDVPERGQIDRPPSTRATQGDFLGAGVGLVFERRCGSLDCHGSVARNMRIYSSDGLRAPNEAGLGPGNGSTTNAEKLANYQSVLGVEPLATREVLLGADPYTMLVMKKPLLIESHKGGGVFRQGDDTETCVYSWLTSDPDGGAVTNLAACTAAANFPRE